MKSIIGWDMPSAEIRRLFAICLGGFVFFDLLSCFVCFMCLFVVWMLFCFQLFLWLEVNQQIHEIRFFDFLFVFNNLYNTCVFHGLRDPKVHVCVFCCVFLLPVDVPS